MSPPTLREPAEAAVRAAPTDKAPMAPEDTLRLVHELQVHQVELEMQNEELRHAQAELAESRDRLAELYDLAPTGYLTLDDGATIREANLTAAALLGVERRQFAGQEFIHFVAPESQDTFCHHQRAVFSSDENQICEMVLRRADGTTFPAQMETIRVEGPATRVRLCRCVISDLTVRRQAGAELQKHRQHLEELVRDRTARLEATIGQLRASNAELEHFNRAMVERELRMIELKKEVNALCAQAGQLPRYPLECDKEPPA
jgi:PAS domain S-box-containing protein